LLATKQASRLHKRLMNILSYSTTYDPSLFLPALLSSFKKRNHVAADYSRTVDIFPNRDALLEYHNALTLEANLEEALSADNSSVQMGIQDEKGKAKAIDSATRPSAERAKAVRKIWQGVYDRWKALMASKDDQRLTTPLRLRFHHGEYTTLLLRILSKNNKLRIFSLGHIWTRIVVCNCFMNYRDPHPEYRSVQRHRSSRNTKRV